MAHIRIVSGGQTGADRAALDAALEAGIECGGWCPRARRAEDGPIEQRYPLQETDAANYASRTRRNVRESDATLIVVRTMAEMSDGTRLTVKEAEKLGRPFLLADLSAVSSVDMEAGRIAAWIADNDIAVLNVAGPRESRSPGIYDSVRALVSAVIGELSSP